MCLKIYPDDILDSIPEEDKTCGNCAHWGKNAGGAIQIKNMWEYRKDGGTVDFPIYECKANKGEIEADVGSRHYTVCLGPDCNCLNHAGAWEPCDEYLEAHEDDVAYQRDPYAYNGVSRADFM